MNEHKATGPAIVDGVAVCTTCQGPVHVYSPDFDSAELRHGAEFEADPLVAASIALEVAVDEYAAAIYRLTARREWPRGEDQGFLLRRRDAVRDAATEVAATMHDGDVSLVDSTYATNVIPRELRNEVAQAELGSLRALRAARALASKPPKGAALSEIRAWDKRMQAAAR